MKTQTKIWGLSELLETLASPFLTRTLKPNPKRLQQDVTVSYGTEEFKVKKLLNRRGYF